MFMKMPNALPMRLLRPSIDQVAVDALSPSGLTENPDVATDANGLMNSSRIVSSADSLLPPRGGLLPVIVMRPCPTSLLPSQA